MTKIAFLPVQQLLKEKIPDVTIAKKAISIALGVTAARLAPLPSSAVNVAEEHFATQASGFVNEIVCGFNEEIVIDVDLALETARAHWLIRYFSAYPYTDAPINTVGECDFLLKLCNGLSFLNPDTRAFCDANTDVVVQLINRISLLVRQDTPGEASASLTQVQTDEAAARGL